MNLLMITQRIDLDDSMLGFAHMWASKLAERIDKLYILTLWLGRYHLAPNVEVYSMKKELGAKKLGKFINFNKVVSNLVLHHKIDGIFIHQCEIYGILAAPYAKLRSIPIVLFKAHKGIPFTLRIAKLLFDKFVTSSEEGFELKTHKKFVISQGIDVELFKPIPIERRNTTPQILSVGRISPVKDYETLIRAADILINQMKQSHLEFEVFGDVGTESQRSYFDKLRQMVSEYQLEEHFHFRGAVPNKEVFKYLNECDLFVNLSGTGSLDKAVLEAMACGKIVLTSNISYKRVLADCDPNLMIEEKNYGELARKIIDYLTLDEKVRKNLGLQLRNIVVANHSIDYFMDKLVSVFYELLKQQGK